MIGLITTSCLLIAITAFPLASAQATPTCTDGATCAADICQLCQCYLGDGEYNSVTCLADHLVVNASRPFEGIGVHPEVYALGVYNGETDVDLVLEDDVLGRHFPSLQSVSLSCHIADIKTRAFEGLAHLTVVDFYSNGLREIPSVALEPLAGSLVELSITSQPEIQRLSAWGPVIFSNLTKLYLVDNGIQSLDPHSFRGLPNLRELSLKSNNIRIVENLFNDLHYLEILDLSLNNISDIPRSLDILSNLKELYLSWNKIANVQTFDFLLRLPEISVLHMDSNAIRSIDKQATNNLINSSLIDAKFCNNPFVCNETLCDYISYTQFFQIHEPIWGSDIGPQCAYTCSLPLKFFLRDFSDVYAEVCFEDIPPPFPAYNTTTPPGQQIHITHDKKSVNIIDVVLSILTVVGLAFGVAILLSLRRLKRLRRGFIFPGRGLLHWRRDEANPDIRYDALVYHHSNDSHFVDHRLRPRLEEGPDEFRLCLSLTRDFRLGAKKLNNLRESLTASRCAVFVISQCFVADARCRQALEIACDYLHRDDLGPPHLRQTGLILIVLDPVLLDQLPETLRVLVDRLVTLEWENINEERCWLRLEQSLRNFRDFRREV